MDTFENIVDFKELSAFLRLPIKARQEELRHYFLNDHKLICV